MDRTPSISLSRSLTSAVIVWAGITAASIVCTLWLYLARGQQGIRAVAMAGPSSDLPLTLLSVAISWLLVGGCLAMLRSRRVHAGNVLAVAGFFLIGLLYVNVLRERQTYGDVADYSQAAANLYFHQPLHARYLYPPLWATILEPLVPLGASAIFEFTWLLNLVSLCGLYLLLQRALRRYGFSAHLAAIVTFTFMVVNVPILRTLCYVQVNLHVTNLILAALIFYPSSRLVSALALSLAIQLKASPAVLVLVFVLERDVRWLAWFGLWTLTIVAATVVVNGWSPYHDFLVNIQHIYGANGMAFRENSFDSFFHALVALSGHGSKWAGGVILASKLMLAAAVLRIARLSVTRRLFYEGGGQGTVVLNATPVLLILMTMASPLVWEHHPVFVSLSYLVLLKGLSSPVEWLIYGVAYYVEFLVPTFDFFPWSFGRLISPLVWLALVGSLSRQSWPSPWLAKVNAWLTDVKLPQTFVDSDSESARIAAGQ